MQSPSPSYREFPLADLRATEVQADPSRCFLVLSGTRTRTGEPWTLVLERRNDYWISRRDLSDRFDPSAAVSGYLFSREGYEDPVALLQRMNEMVRGEYYRILQEKIRIEQTRAELAGELSRLKDEHEELKRKLRRRIGRSEAVGRRSPSASSARRSRRHR